MWCLRLQVVAVRAVIFVETCFRDIARLYLSTLVTSRNTDTSLVKSIRDLLFSRGPSVARQPHHPLEQAVAQQPAHEINPELIIEFLRWPIYHLGTK